MADETEKKDDELLIEILEYQGQKTLLKKKKDACKGILSHVKADPRYSDEESLLDTVDKRRQ
jgi:hypothetical protein